MKAILLALVSVIALVNAEVFFKETFDKTWESRWVQSKAKSDLGLFKRSAGKYFSDADKDAGIQTSQDARFYHLAAKFEPFSNKDKKLVIQYQVKHEQGIDCGGGYVKVMPSTDLENFNGDSLYNIMFGPDICGATKKVHVIFQYKGDNKLIKKEIRCKDDVFSHVYTLIVNPDNTYEVLIDNESAQKGSLEEDWDFLPPKEIEDPNASKPDDWDEREKIPDPEDTKPADWDKPKQIADPDAEKPEDWDDETDGEWEAPMIDNPEYKGEWAPKMIPNPAYKGKWIHPKIANPAYKPDPELYAYDEFGAIGFDLWQVKSGTVFDNIIITDDVAEAKKFAEDTWGALKEAEKKQKEADDEKERKAREEEEERRKKEEEAKKATEEEEEDDDDDEEEEKPVKDEL
eukprot:Colp12_sorted_trinity150504_noHs@12192